MIRLLIVADDLTGALYAGAQFAERGAVTSVVTNLDTDLTVTECDVLVIDAETRRLSAEYALPLVQGMISAAKAVGVPNIYKNTDSGLMENIGGDVPAVMDATSVTPTALAESLNLNGIPPERPNLTKSFFVVCGSVNPATRRQVREAERCGFRRICLAVRQKLDPEWLKSDGCAQTVDRWIADANKRRRIILDANDEAADKATKQFAVENGLDDEQVWVRTSEALAGVSKALLDHGLETTLMYVGGGTLLSLTKALGVSSLTPLCEMDSGVVLTRLEYRGRKYNIIAKSGAAGESDLLCRLAEQISV